MLMLHPPYVESMNFMYIRAFYCILDVIWLYN